MFKAISLPITLLAVALFATSYAQLQGQNANAKPTAVATVDLNALLLNLDEQSAIKAAIIVMQEKMQRQEQEKKTELKALQEDLKISKQGTDSAKKLMEKLQMKAMEFEVWGKFAQQKLANEQVIRTKAIYKKLTETIAEVAKKNKCDVVLQKDGVKDFAKLRVQNNQQLLNVIGGHKVLYAANTIDITDEVTQKMNNDFNNAKK